MIEQHEIHTKSRGRPNVFIFVLINVRVTCVYQIISLHSIYNENWLKNDLQFI